MKTTLKIDSIKIGDSLIQQVEITGVSVETEIGGIEFCNYVETVGQVVTRMIEAQTKR